MSYYHVGPCASNPCKNGGECSVRVRGRIKTYRCKCKRGYNYGKSCENAKKGKYVCLKLPSVLLFLLHNQKNI